MEYKIDLAFDIGNSSLNRQFSQKDNFKGKISVPITDDGLRSNEGMSMLTSLSGAGGHDSN